MLDHIFREYDIRGKVDQELFLDQVYEFGRAIAYYFVLKQPKTTKIAVGMDGRTHSPIIKDLLCAGLIDSGLDVVFVGLCPSPALYFSLHAYEVDAGIMITASHNPKEYNGFKICLGKESLWGGQIREIRSFFKQKKYILTGHKGVYQEQEIIPAYVDWLANNFSQLKDFDLPVVVDCGNGAGGTVMPLLKQKMNWHAMDLLYPEVDGTYPNHEADPVVEENMREVKKILRTSPIQLGIGLDGDCDRMAPMTKSGYLVPGDKLLALFAQPLIKKNKELNDVTSVVCDIKSSASLITLLEQWGADVHMSPSGHAIIKENMGKTGAILGGELSCHFVFNDRYFGYDDGIYAMLRLFELLQASGKTLDELLDIFPVTYSSPEFRIECDENQKQMIIKQVQYFFMQKKDARFISIDGMRVTLDYGWGLVRASNTQPVICIRFESNSYKGMEQLRDDFVLALRDSLEVTTIEQLS